MAIITIIEHVVRQYEVEDGLEDNFDPWDNDTYITELVVDCDTQEELTDGWEIV